MLILRIFPNVIYISPYYPLSYSWSLMPAQTDFLIGAWYCWASLVIAKCQLNTPNIMSRLE